MRGRALTLARSLLLALAALCRAAPAQADGGFPDVRQLLLPQARPEQIILGTNFGLVLSEDAGESWLFSCEQKLNAYASVYLLGAQPGHRIFAVTSGAGLIYSDDDSCSWTAAQGSLSGVLPYSVAIDPSDPRRVYVIGVAPDTSNGQESIYASDDGGLTFEGPKLMAPAQSALLNLLVAPSQPDTLFVSMFSAPQNHPSLLRSRDRGEHWEVVSDLSESLGDVPFELLAVDANDENRLFVRVLGPSAEALAVSDDGGLSFVPSVSIAGKLTAFLQLSSGTILLAGTAGTQAVGYRSKDDARTFERWPEAPHVHALAERNGTLYVAADNFADGYVVAVSDDEGAHLKALAGFDDVQAVKSCVASACTDSCAYYADIKLWPSAVCGSQPNGGEILDPLGGGGGSDAGAGGAASEHAPLGGDTSQAPAESPRLGGNCACRLPVALPLTGRSEVWASLLVAASALAGRRRRRRVAQRAI